MGCDCAQLASFRLSLGQSLLTTLEAESRWMRRTGQVQGERRKSKGARAFVAASRLCPMAYN